MKDNKNEQLLNNWQYKYDVMLVKFRKRLFYSQ